MTSIVINDKVKLVHNGYGWEPYTWREAEIIPVGTRKGEMSTPKWKTTGSYFSDIPAALVKVAKNEVNNGEEYTLEGYIKAYNEASNRIIASVNKVMNK